MYFDFDDRRPDTPTLDAPMSRREAGVLSVFLHLVVLLALIYAPRIPWVQAAMVRAQQAVEQRVAQQIERLQRDQPRYVFVQPRIDTPAPAPPPRAFFSDQDRVARSVERAPVPENELPFSRGNTTEFVESQQSARARGQGPAPEPGDAAARVTRPNVRTAAARPTWAPGQAPRRTREPRGPRGGTWATRSAISIATSRTRTSTTDKGLERSARPFSSTPRASSSARGSAASLLRSSVTGSSRWRPCR